MTSAGISLLMLVLAGAAVAFSHWAGTQLGKRASRRAHVGLAVTMRGEGEVVVERVQATAPRAIIVGTSADQEIDGGDEDDEKLIEDFRSYINALSQGRRSFDDLT